ncbi:Cytidine/deoxycytidylate deaminase, zinc-binding domain [Dillenia turbinata]|uniref:cytidine deaminase n=1 Tax=Dillenia turbinata TaxID=194707 RepID=A0AAN8W7J6_9MAGN
METQMFIIEASEAESMAKKAGLTTVLQLLPKLVRSAQKLARPPISKYHVGAVGLGSSGRIFYGANLEFPNLPLHHAVHAEQFLLTNLSLHGESSLSHLAVSAAPCGHCRQFLQEIRNASNTQILILPEDDKNGDFDESSFVKLIDLLVRPFGPNDLLLKEVPLLLEKHNNRLELVKQHVNGEDKKLRNGFSNLALEEIDGEKGKLGNGFLNSSDLQSNLVVVALEAANNAHAHYSKCPSGVSLMDTEGKIYKGSYAESAAYNPSLGPLQAAIIGYIASGGKGYDKIVKAVLVEKEDAVVKQEDTARLLLKMISPNCEFRVVHCCSSDVKANGV